MMSEDVKFMLKRFPSFTDEIVEAYAKNEEFKSLCEDIYSMTQALERGERRVFNDHSHELEYRKLLLDLESELLKYFEKLKGLNGSQRGR